MRIFQQMNEFPEKKYWLKSVDNAFSEPHMYDKTYFKPTFS